MKTIVIATNNQNKVREIKSLFNSNKIEFKTLKDLNYTKEIVENGKTFAENAYIKAYQVAQDLNCVAISDDSGLEVEALNGAPGIYSARYAGGHDDEKNNELLIKNLQGVDNRRARYVCAICVCQPNGIHKIVEGYCNGIIVDSPKGKNGFGYDPIFYVDEYGCSTAELDSETKNRISHRGKALRACKERIAKLL